mgnify:CR=1 FL=1
MASKKVEMYAKKRYELDEIKNKIKEEFDKRKFSDVEFKDVNWETPKHYY